MRKALDAQGFGFKDFWVRGSLVGRFDAIRFTAVGWGHCRWLESLPLAGALTSFFIRSASIKGGFGSFRRKTVTAPAICHLIGDL